MKSAALILAACLAFASTVEGQNPVWQRRSHLDKEDLRSAAFWIQKKDPRAERFDAVDKLPIDSTYSVLLVDANLDWRKRPEATGDEIEDTGSFGLFVVYGKTNQVYMVLDVLPRKDFRVCGPQIQEATPDSVLLEFLADYGSYHGTLKYVYDLPQKKIHARMRFGRVDLLASAISEGVAHYAAPTVLSSESTVVTERRSFIIAVRPGPGDSPPYCRLIEWKRGDPPQQVRIDVRDKALVAGWDNDREMAWELPNLARRVTPPIEAPPEPLPHTILEGHSLPAGNILRVKQPGVSAKALAIVYKNGLPLAMSEQRTGIYLFFPNRKPIFYPKPAPDPDTFAKFRGNGYCGRYKPTADGIENNFGPFVLAGSTLWFANDFYGGEGMTGVGAIGSFDLKSRKYEMRYSPEIAPWSASAILVEKDAIWVGLMFQPEGGAYSGGLFRYDRNTGQTRRFPFPGIVRTIDRMGDGLYLGATYGLYVLKGDELTQYRFEPVSPGNWGMVTRRVLTVPQRGSQ